MSQAINPVPYLKNAGFSGNLLVIATAIMGAESSFIPTKYNAEADFFAARGIVPAMAQGKGSYGLCQCFEFEHPEFAGWNHLDPQVNACEMAMIWYRAGKSFTPWSTFRVQPPAYLAHVEQAQAFIAAA